MDTHKGDEYLQVESESSLDKHSYLKAFSIGLCNQKDSEGKTMMVQEVFQVREIMQHNNTTNYLETGQ